MADKIKGRPKTEQNRPLIFQRGRTRVVREIPISSRTAEMLDRYVEWAALQVDADKEETLTLTVEQALELLFKKDRLFQDSIDDSTEAGIVVEGAGEKKTSPAPGPAAVAPTITRPGA